jgi:hypothetical protein
MTSPIDPSSYSPTSPFPNSDPTIAPLSGPPLPIENPCVQMFINTGVPPAEAQVAGTKFQNNLMQSLNSQIKKDDAISKKRRQEAKEALGIE